MRTYYLEDIFTLQTWNMSPHGLTPFTASSGSGWSRNYNFLNNAGFSFVEGEETAQQRTLTGRMVFKAKTGKTAEELMREFTDFATKANNLKVLDPTKTDEWVAAGGLDVIKKDSAYRNVFSRGLKIHSCQNGVSSRYAYCHLVSINNPVRHGRDILADVSFSLDSLWLEYHEFIGSCGNDDNSVKSLHITMKEGVNVCNKPNGDVEEFTGRDQTLSNRGQVPAFIGVAIAGAVKELQVEDDYSNGNAHGGAYERAKSVYYDLSNGSFDQFIFGLVNNVERCVFINGSPRYTITSAIGALTSDGGYLFNTENGHYPMDISIYMYINSYARIYYRIFWEEGFFNE